MRIRGMRSGRPDGFADGDGRSDAERYAANYVPADANPHDKRAAAKPRRVRRAAPDSGQHSRHIVFGSAESDSVILMGVAEIKEPLKHPMLQRLFI